MRPELEGRHDAEVAAGAAHRPEQVLVLRRAGPPELPVGGDDVDGQEAVDRESVLPAQMTEPAVQRQPGDAGRRDDAGRYREPEQLGLAVTVAPGRAALHADGLRRRVDGHSAHLREVDDDAAVVDGVPGDVVPAGLDREREALLTGEVHRVDDICCAAALHDQRRSPIDQRIPDRARVVVSGAVLREQRSADPCRESRQLLRVELCFRCRLARHRFPPLRACMKLARAYARRPREPKAPPHGLTPRSFPGKGRDRSSCDRHWVRGDRPCAFLGEVEH